MSDEVSDVLVPIDYMVIEFPGRVFDRELAPDLVDLVERGLVGIVDLLFVHKNEDGTVTPIEMDDVAPEETGLLASLDCGLPGLLTSEDVTSVTSGLDVGASAVIIVWENLWAAPFSASIRRLGGQLVASGRFAIADLLGSANEEDGDEPQEE